MAKRGILEHHKTLMLADELAIMEPFAVGILEVFWHWVAKYHPRGDISGTKPGLMARAIRYSGDAQRLWEALIACGFIEQNGDRIVVHDWSEHADNSVHQLLKKRNEEFADGHKPFTRNHKRFVNGSPTNDGEVVNGSRLPEPEPEPLPEPKKKTLARSVPPEELAGTLPLVDGSDYHVSKAQVFEWSQAFPGVDVKTELKKFKVWLDANPTRKKTPKGIQKAIVGWLCRAQDGGRSPTQFGAVKINPLDLVTFANGVKQ